MRPKKKKKVTHNFALIIKIDGDYSLTFIRQKNHLYCFMTRICLRPTFFTYFVEQRIKGYIYVLLGVLRN